MWCASPVHDNVRRFDISVDDIVFVGVLQCLGKLHHQLRRLTNIESPLVHPRLQRVPIHELGHNKADIVFGLPGLVKRNDARMLQLRRTLGFAEEPSNIVLSGEPASALNL